MIFNRMLADYWAKEAAAYGVSMNALLAAKCSSKQGGLAGHLAGLKLAEVSFSDVAGAGAAGYGAYRTYDQYGEPNVERYKLLADKINNQSNLQTGT